MVVEVLGRWQAGAGAVVRCPAPVRGEGGKREETYIKCDSGGGLCACDRHGRVEVVTVVMAGGSVRWCQ